MKMNEKSQVAVALAYRSSQTAPQVIAKGRGLIAEEIIKRAKASGIYVHESAELVALLAQINLDERIPPQLYVAIAELLAWLYRLENSEETLTDRHTETKSLTTRRVENNVQS